MGQFQPSVDLDELVESSLEDAKVVDLPSRPLEAARQPLGGQHNQPSYTLKKEQPEHRIMVMLRAQGKSIKWIATKVSYTKEAVGQILRQEWAKKLLVEIIAEAGEDSVTKIFELEAMDSIDVLRDIRDNPNVAASTRAACAFHFLDRHLGKPTTFSEVAVSNTEQSLDAIEKRLERAKAEVEERLGLAKPANAVEIPTEVTK